MIEHQILKNGALSYKNDPHSLFIFFGIIVKHDCDFELQNRVNSQLQNIPNTQFFLRPMYYSCFEKLVKN